MNPDPKDRLRLFFALWPNVAERTALAAWQAPLHALCGGRLMQMDTLHSTLVFLGEVEAHRLEALQLAAQEVSSPRFGWSLAEAHYWGHNHIVYAAPEIAPAPLVELVDKLERNLRKHHFHFDVRPYKPHVTLLRNAHWGDASKIGDPLLSLPAVDWRVDDFVLVSSLNGASSARYEVLAQFPLSGEC